MIFVSLTIFFSFINMVSAEIFGDYNCTYFVNFATTDVVRSQTSVQNLIIFPIFSLDILHPLFLART